MANVLAPLVTSIQVDTAWGPPILIEDPFGDQPGVASSLGGILKPKITVNLSTGAPIVSAPYGDPGETKWPIVSLALIAAGLVGGYFLLRRFVR